MRDSFKNHLEWLEKFGRDNRPMLYRARISVPDAMRYILRLISGQIDGVLRAIMLLLTLSLCGTAIAGTVAQEKAAALAEVNFIRQSVGLASVGVNAKIGQAAQSHADYLLTNVGGPDHFQISGKPGFTGVNPGARLNAAGYAWQRYTEVIDGGMQSGKNAVKALIQAIYHRFGILNTAVSEVGVGIASSATMPIMVFDFGALPLNAATLSSAWRGTYPIDNQTDVPVDFYSDTEAPDPVPNANRVGYPVSFHLPEGETLATTSFTLAPAGGANIATLLLVAPTDPNVPANVAAIVPLVPLSYDTNYVVAFSGTRALGQPVNASWSFRTAPYVPLVVDQPRQRVLNGSLAWVQVAGGEGAGIIEGNYSYSTQWVSRSNVSSALNIIALGNGLYELRATQPTNAWITFHDQQNHQVTAEIIFAEPVTETPILTAGWNLLGNGLAAPIDVAARFGTNAAPLPGITSNIKTIWKWIPATAKWAFYSPALPDGGLSYAASKGYDFLTTLNPGEGYWVNSSASITLSPRSGSAAATVATGLPNGWSLLAVGGEAMTPAALDKALPGGQLNGLATWCTTATCFLSSGNLPATASYKTLWTWSAAQSSWRFYAPALAAQGQAALDSYTQSKGYQTFDTQEKIWLAPGEGFWINR